MRYCLKPPPPPLLRTTTSLFGEPPTHLPTGGFQPRDHDGACSRWAKWGQPVTQPWTWVSWRRPARTVVIESRGEPAQPEHKADIATRPLRTPRLPCSPSHYAAMIFSNDGDSHIEGHFCKRFNGVGQRGWGIPANAHKMSTYPPPPPPPANGWVPSSAFSHMRQEVLGIRHPMIIMFPA